MDRPRLLWALALMTVAALTGFRLWAMSQTDLVPDEAYYWLWSRVPSAGYYDHPPMIAWWIWLSTAIFGDTVFGVRILSVLSVFVSSIAVYGTVIELYGDAALARRATVWLNAMLLVALAALFATPDAPSLMFWALSVWALARLWRTGNPWLWIAIGVFAGAGCVGKYTNFFIGPGILLWLVIDRRAAPWRFSPWLLAGGATAFAVFLPVLIWNAEHGWISFTKQFGRIGDHHFGLSAPLEFLAGQFGLMNPLIFILVAVAIWRFSTDRDRLADPMIVLIALTMPLLAYLTFHALHDRVHANWSLPAYPALAIASALIAGHPSNGPHIRRMVLCVLPVGIGLSCLLLLYFATPLGLRFPWPSPADNVIGWRDLVRDAEKLKQQSGAGWIATTDYGLTGEIAFYSGDPANVQSIVDRQRYVFETVDPELAAKPALLLVRLGAERPDVYLKCFQTAGPAQAITRRAGNRIIEAYAAIVVSGAQAGLLEKGCHI